MAVPRRSVPGRASDPRHQQRVPAAAARRPHPVRVPESRPRRRRLALHVLPHLRLVLGRRRPDLPVVEEHVPSGVNGLWEPFLRIARDGSVQCYYSAENSADNQDNFMKYSTDGGATWSHWVAVSGGDRSSRDGMASVAPIDNNGNLMSVPASPTSISHTNCTAAPSSKTLRAGPFPSTTSSRTTTARR